MAEHSQINEPAEIWKMLKAASEEGFWGSMLFSFQAGKLVLVKKEMTVKVRNIDFSNS